MELREFAEQVLFSTSLGEKLACPGALTDLAPGPAMRAPHQPGRPRELLFRTGTSRESLPGVPHLEKEAARGRLLHFFANHELLATELMALVLLKFPDAPKPFRRGILQTLRDEQEHTRMYMARMRDLGLEFGAHPVNGYFWNLIASMESPMDYVNRLSLTFEQANLDYSGYFAEQFRRIGDKASEALLTRIHHDEVAHVGYGLKWFRRWKDPDRTDWEAFEAALPYPLSPSRAKGIGFNAEARRRAGLDAPFIHELFVYAKSKGRTPGVFLFNPLAETRMGRAAGYQPRAHLEGFMRDLSNLPQFLCRTDDVVLVHRRPATAFLAGLKEAGFELPQFEVLENGQLARDSELRLRKIGSLRPWAWSPDSIRVLEPLLPNLTRPAMPVGPDWKGRIQPLFSKAWAAERLREFLSDQSCVLPPHSSAWLTPPAHIGRVAHSVEEALHHIEAFRAAGHPDLVAKAVHSQAGMGLLRLREGLLKEPQRAWIARQIETPGSVLIEPWLDRVLDFSCQFEMEDSGLRHKGFVRMINDARGQYQSSIHSRSGTRGWPAELARFVHGPGGDRMKLLFEGLRAFLEVPLARAGFRGPIGVDAMIHREPDGSLRLKPVVEINPRYTMGRLLIELMRQARPGGTGRLDLVNRAALRRLGHDSFASHAAALRVQAPPRFHPEGPRRLSGGALCLNDPAEATQVLAVFSLV